MIRMVGTSPRMRGKPILNGNVLATQRNIPAYAGKTNSPRRVALQLPEHPRVCGENARDAFDEVDVAGTSPRMRGKPR